MKFAYGYDENNIFTSLVPIEIIEHEDGTLEEIIPTNSTLVAPPNGLYKAKWDGDSWEESATNDYIETIKVGDGKGNSSVTDTQKMMADLLALMIENEVI